MNTQRVRLKELSDVITKGTTPTSLGFNFAESGIGFLRVQNLFDGKVNFERDTLFINEKVHRELRRSQILPDDVLITIAGTIGRIGVVPKNTPPLNCNQAIAIVRPKASVSHSYLRHWLESNDAQSQMRGSTVTGTIQNLSLAQVGNLHVPILPIPEQMRIASILDQVDALRVKRRNVLSELDNLTQAIFIDMFGDPVTNPKGWEVDTIGSACEPVSTWNPMRQPQDNVFTYIDIGSIDAISKSIIDPHILQCSDAPSRAKQILQAGDILVSTVRPNLNAVAVVPDKFNSATGSTGFCVLRAKPDRLIHKFLFCYLRSERFISAMMRQATGASYPAISDRIVKSVVFPFPPLPLQRRFANLTDTIEKLKLVNQNSLTEFDNLYASLQQLVFEGEL